MKIRESNYYNYICNFFEKAVLNCIARQKYFRSSHMKKRIKKISQTHAHILQCFVGTYKSHDKGMCLISLMLLLKSKKY